MKTERDFGDYDDQDFELDDEESEETETDELEAEAPPLLPDPRWHPF